MAERPISIAKTSGDAASKTVNKRMRNSKVFSKVALLNLAIVQNLGEA